MEISELKKGQKASVIVSVIILLLALSKGIAGYLSDSSALIGDAIHSGVDLVVMFASWVGLKISQREPTERFPYGFYKAESLATLFISLFILYASYELIREGYSRLFTISRINMPVLALAVVFCAAVTTVFTSRYLAKIGRKINAESLMVASREQLVDAFTSAGVFVAVLLSYFQIRYAEGIATIVIALLILRIGIISARDAIFSLMDVSPSKDVERKVEEIIKEDQAIDNFSNLKLRRSGPYVFGEVNVEVKKFINVDKAHVIIDKLEKKIKEIKAVDSFVVHVEPYKSKDFKIVIPVMEDEGLKSKIMEHFGRAKYFLFCNIKGEEIKKYYIKENEYKDKDIRAGLAAAHFIKEENANILITREIGEISFHTLRDSLVDVYITEDEAAEDIIKKFSQGKLKRLGSPTKEKD
ncbi:MAG: cation diffusion facilitator family transporter [Candidatus Humimicrobiaceae bacterium]